MSDTQHDDYLWNRSGPADPEVAQIERELGELGWRPRSLSLPSQPAILAQERVPMPAIPIRRSVDHSGPRAWPAWIAGLAMAATVLGALYLARDEPDGGQSGEPDASIESIDPAGQPSQSPDLRDPFAKTGDSAAPQTEVVPSGDLKDPFHNGPIAPQPESRKPKPKPRPYYDLKDPWGPADQPVHRPSAANADLKDPFSRETSTSKDSGSDLVDPFGKPR